MTNEEQMKTLVAMDEHLSNEIKKAQHELETYLKAQHETRRKIFNLQFEMRQR